MRRVVTWVGIAAMALLLSACYPFNPSVNECRQEQYPPYCGCPKPGGGVYVDGRDTCAIAP